MNLKKTVLTLAMMTVAGAAMAAGCHADFSNCDQSAAPMQVAQNDQGSEANPLAFPPTQSDASTPAADASAPAANASAPTAKVSSNDAWASMSQQQTADRSSH